QSLDDYRVEVVLARILADWREPRAIPYLLQCINLQDEGASRIAAEGLVAFGDEPRVIDALAELLSLPSSHDRQIAASVLQRISSNRVLDLFMERYKAETERDIRGIFVVKLISSRHPKRSAFLVEALADPDEGIRALAWQALQKSPALPKVAFAAAGPMENRAKDVAALRIWVRDRGGKAQLAP
ncbi:MAG TPA: HEAT repeat domain-containing protein, partial [Planctomycetota bacterium]|nr:HEAT repeat domain-containing protein [Planctomycetota bacterium]